MTARVLPNRRRRAFMPLTEMRAARLRAALTLYEVAQASGISGTRLSMAERDVDSITPEEASRVREAVAKLVRERGQEQGR